MRPPAAWRLGPSGRRQRLQTGARRGGRGCKQAGHSGALAPHRLRPGARDRSRSSQLWHSSRDHSAWQPTPTLL
eukprot:scaffold1249_cov122-Isochrysis_galbana.AAC.3